MDTLDPPFFVAYSLRSFDYPRPRVVFLLLSFWSYNHPHTHIYTPLHVLRLPTLVDDRGTVALQHRLYR